MNSEETAATTTRLPAKLLEELQHATISRRVSQQQAIIEAIEMWLAGGRPAIPLDDVPAEDTPLVLAFPRFLRKAHPETAGYVRSIIRQWLTLDAAGRRARESGRQNSGT